MAIQSGMAADHCSWLISDSAEYTDIGLIPLGPAKSELEYHPQPSKYACNSEAPRKSHSHYPYVSPAPPPALSVIGYPKSQPCYYAWESSPCTSSPACSTPISAAAYRAEDSRRWRRVLLMSRIQFFFRLIIYHCYKLRLLQFLITKITKDVMNVTSLYYNFSFTSIWGLYVCSLILCICELLIQS